MGRTQRIVGAQSAPSTTATVAFTEIITDRGIIYVQTALVRLWKRSGDKITLTAELPGDAAEISYREAALGILADDPDDPPSPEAMARTIGCDPGTLRKDAKFMRVYRAVAIRNAPARGRRDDGDVTPESDNEL